MAVHLINPSDNSFGTAVITPRWLFVLAAATPVSMGDPTLVDESLEQLDPQLFAALHTHLSSEELADALVIAAGTAEVAESRLW